ncbi:MAG: phosphate acyltransferase PlsX [Christensenellaceae bacterium]|jgi:glycerol-3-phosphate acyltransferase PlsX|nr:phosphate acyltransferase PlsX [Christensenellaceae bacterium]
MNKKVILDVLGGDHGAASTLPAAVMALKQDKGLNLVLVGDKDVISAHKELAPVIDRCEIIHTTTNIGMNEHPVEAIRTKKDSSICLGMDALRTREDCTAFVSAGSTGAVLTGGFMKVGRIPGVSRPALCTKLMTYDKRGVLVLDLGANMDCKPENLVHFAIMADAYWRANPPLMNFDRYKNVKPVPRVALLSVGTEDEKGNELTLVAFAELKKLHDAGKLNFVGNMEARDTFSGKYDIVVADGFAGNVLLKTLEGTGKLFSHELKKAISGPFVLLGKLILAVRLLKMKKNLSEDATGGAILLGCKKPVIKAHGNSGARALCNAILLGRRAGDMNLYGEIEKAIGSLT